MNSGDPTGLLELKSSINKYGLLQPIVVRPAKNKRGVDRESGQLGESEEAGFYSFEIISGHRRYLACKELAFDSIPAFVHDLDDREALELALVENIQRESLNPIEEAEAFKKYVVNFGRGSITSLATRIGKSEVYVSHRLLLLGLPKSITEKISRRLLKPGQACELVWLKDNQKQTELADEITSKNLSVKETRNIIKAIKDDKLPVSIAVQRRHRGSKRELGNETSLSEPWQNYYQTRDPQETDDIRTLKHAELIIRSCLSGLDALIERTEEHQIRCVILNERQTVHNCLDKIIQAQVANRRENTFE